MSNNALPAALTIAFTLQPAAVAVIFKTRDCERFDDDSYMLREDYSISCLLPEHKFMLTYTGFMFCFWAPLPVLFFVILWIHKSQLEKEGPARDNHAIDWFRQLFDSYKPGCFWSVRSFHWLFPLLHLSLCWFGLG